MSAMVFSFDDCDFGDCGSRRPSMREARGSTLADAVLHRPRALVRVAWAGSTDAGSTGTDPDVSMARSARRPPRRASAQTQAARRDGRDGGARPARGRAAPGRRAARRGAVAAEHGDQDPDAVELVARGAV